jgi:hypothetical protein
VERRALGKDEDILLEWAVQIVPPFYGTWYDGSQ